MAATASPEQPDPHTATDLTEYIAHLSWLRECAGSPGYKAMERTAAERVGIGALPRSTTHRF